MAKGEAMIVLGLDPSLTSTGVAVLTDGRPSALRAIGHGTPNGKSYAHRSDRIVSQARAVMRFVEDHATPDLAVIEGPAYGANMPSAFDRAGLFWGLYSTLRARRVPIAVVAPKTRALWATANGGADKRMVLTAMRASGSAPTRTRSPTMTWQMRWRWLRWAPGGWATRTWTSRSRIGRSMRSMS